MFSFTFHLALGFIMFLRKLFSYIKQTVKNMFIIMDIALDEKIYEQNDCKSEIKTLFGSFERILFQK